MKKYVLKQIAAAVAAAAMLISSAGCGNKDGGSAPGEGETTAAAVSANDEMRDIPSVELVKEIKIGWNLGNTFDSFITDDVTLETSWGNPVTTKEMVTAVKDAGFNIIRIPVTWFPHLDENNNIDKEWLDRVQEVVDYAYSQDMFVIINLHHEDWNDTFYDNEAAATEKLKTLWKQIGTHFEGYGERLIFEAMNEPRMRNTNNEWTGGNKEGHEVVNRFNAAFVETVRGLGGNNAKRHLMIPVYCASSSPDAMKALEIPAGDDKIIVSVHAYVPYGFALGDDLNDNKFTADGRTTGDINYVMDNIKKIFLDKNIPVILGECGARAKDNTEARTVWAEYYISKAKEIGVPCIIWDNGAFEGDGENFGLLDRQNCKWAYPEIIDSFMKGLK